MEEKTVPKTEEETAPECKKTFQSPTTSVLSEQLNEKREEKLNMEDELEMEEYENRANEIAPKPKITIWSATTFVSRKPPRDKRVPKKPIEKPMKVVKKKSAVQKYMESEEYKKDMAKEKKMKMKMKKVKKVVPEEVTPKTSSGWDSSDWDSPLEDESPSKPSEYLDMPGERRPSTRKFIFK